MAASSFDLAGLVLLEQEIATMAAAEAATPTTFTGATAFTATYRDKVPNTPATVETTNSIALRLTNLRLAFDMLNR